MDSGTQQAASLTMTVTRVVLPKIMLCKLERRPFLLESKLPEALRVFYKMPGSTEREWFLFLRQSSSDPNAYISQRDCKLRYI